MVRFTSLALGLLAACAEQATAVTVYETAASATKVFSKAEIMATMTHERAFATVLSSKHVSVKPEVLTLLKELQKSSAGGNRTEKEVHRHGKDDPKGYSAVDGARDMLNEMMNDAMTKLDNEVETCTTYNRETLVELEAIRQDVASFNSQAAEARSRVLKSQAVISFCNLKLPQVQEELDEHNAECARHQAELNAQIEIVLADLDVMATILEIIGDCSGAAAAALIQCRHCRKSGEGYVMLQDDRLQPLINKLKSSEARKMVQRGLGELYDESTAHDAPVALTQMQVVKLRGSRQDPNDPEFIASMGNSTEHLNISEVPAETAPADCVPTNKCTLGPGNCPKIRDRFLLILSGIQDMHTQLKADLAELLNNCNEERLVMESQLANLGEKLRGAQTDLASATEDQVGAESSSNLKAQQHTEVSHEYGKTMRECCQEQNDLKSEICALEKIRGELFKLKGVEAFITDCEVSDFAAGECSASCGGGVLVKTRSILVHPVNGMACPPLEMRESCNTHPCPIDCIVSDWEGWSGCSAECGGGVRERMRSVTLEMKYDGKPCEDTEETEGCNSQSCNRDCILGDWSSWTSCTQACATGSQRHERPVAEQARGTGVCAEATSVERLEFRECNNMPCTEFYHMEDEGNYLKCGSKLDLIILMDGSGSLGKFGWSQSKLFVQNLLRHLQGGDDHVKVALQLFSGPTTWAAYERCTGVEGAGAPDIVNDCGISWVKHFTNDTFTVADDLEKVAFPSKTTLTDVALAEAEAELMYGREDASSVVMVVTDGKPLSQERTVQAAKQLMEKARIMWVPVGLSAPVELITELASLPKHENIVAIDDFSKLSWPFFVNKLIVQTCPTLA